MALPISTPVSDLAPTLERLRRAHAAKVPDFAQRRDDLRRLRSVFKARMDEMVGAVNADFGGRSRHETLLTDAMTVLAEIDHTLRHLRRWMRPQRRSGIWPIWASSEATATRASSCRHRQTPSWTSPKSFPRKRKTRFI